MHTKLGSMEEGKKRRVSRTGPEPRGVGELKQRSDPYGTAIV